MALNNRSRYNGHPAFTATDRNGVARTTLPMRVPLDLTTGDHFQHTVAVNQSMEFLANRYYGDSELWWRIADANPLVFPLDVSSGERLSVPSAATIGSIIRTRGV